MAEHIDQQARYERLEGRVYGRENFRNSVAEAIAERIANQCRNIALHKDNEARHDSTVRRDAYLNAYHHVING